MNKSVFRAFNIIKYISLNPESASISKISRELDIPKSSVSDIIYSLVDLDILKDKESDHINQKYFELGPLLFQISYQSLSNKDLYVLVNPILEELSKETGATAFLAVRDHNKIIYMQKTSVSSSIVPNIEVGDINDLYYTSEGKCFLSCMQDNQIRNLLGKEPFNKKTEYTYTNYDDLLMNLNEYRDKGFICDIRESNENSLGVAAPVFDFSNKVICTLSIVSVYNNNTISVIDEWGEMVNYYAYMLSKSLGYTYDTINDFYDLLLKYKS